MENCENCGKRIGNDWYDQCDGEMTWDTDPYAMEINDDDTLYWNCKGNRHESAMDI